MDSEVSLEDRYQSILNLLYLFFKSKTALEKILQQKPFLMGNAHKIIPINEDR